MLDINRQDHIVLNDELPRQVDKEKIVQFDADSSSFPFSLLSSLLQTHVSLIHMYTLSARQDDECSESGFCSFSASRNVSGGAQASLTHRQSVFVVSSHRSVDCKSITGVPQSTNKPTI